MFKKIVITSGLVFSLIGSVQAAPAEQFEGHWFVNSFGDSHYPDVLFIAKVDDQNLKIRNFHTLRSGKLNYANPAVNFKIKGDFLYVGDADEPKYELRENKLHFLEADRGDWFFVQEPHSRLRGKDYSYMNIEYKYCPKGIPCF